MDSDIRERTQAYIAARYQHPAWVLLASRRAPLVLGCLQSLFETRQNGIPFEEALQSLGELLGQHANQADFEIGAEDPLALARRDLRDWESALRFVDGLDNRIMTSTASRLSV